MTREPFFDRSGTYPRAIELAIRVVTLDDDEYPERLREIPSPPERLWIAGKDLRTVGPCVSVIGARAANGYGIDVARRLGADLGGSGVCVVSGMARGADAAAHTGALSVNGNTVAVLGCGIDVCYPPGSRDLYEEISARGALVSPFAPGTSVQKSHLVRRNDILIGMSYAVVVVQGDVKSAAVKTARRALDWNREVFGVPGQVDWVESAGVHDLLKMQNAALCTCADDVLKVLNQQLTVEEKPPVAPQNLTPQQQRVMDVLATGAATPDSVILRSGLGTVDGMVAVARLELVGLVRRVGSLIDRAR
jgi:DNA processing protein